jgi:molybdopterin-biosynthesis enzyme MoeA-like protein
VLAGVPKIMQAMLDLLLPKLEGGVRVAARAATVYAPEGDIAGGLARIQANFPTLEIGSYPFFRPAGPGATIVFRGTDPAAIDRAVGALHALAAELGAAIKDADAG